MISTILATPVDSYGYSNSTYTAPQTGYEDYSSGYVDNGGYDHSVPGQILLYFVIAEMNF